MKNSRLNKGLGSNFIRTCIEVDFTLTVAYNCLIYFIINIDQYFLFILFYYYCLLISSP